LSRISDTAMRRRKATADADPAPRAAPATSPTDEDHTSNWIAHLAQPVRAPGLVWFRRAFALGTAADAFSMVRSGEMADFFGEPGRLHFAYPWPLPAPPPLPAHVMAALPHAALACCALLGLGVAPRLGLAGFTAVHAYVFLVDAARYVNHHYLCAPPHARAAHAAAATARARQPTADTRPRSYRYVLLGALLLVAALDGDGGARTRRVHLWTLRAQWTVVYFYGGLTKLNCEWVLRQEPLRTYFELATRPGRLLGVPAVRTALGYEPLIVCAASFALLYDLTVGFALWRRRWLGACVALSAAFHATNAVLFNTISSFPYIGLASAALFLGCDDVAPEHGARDDREPPSAAGGSRGARARLVSCRGAAALWFAGAWLTTQTLLPLRHWLYSSDVSWTRLGNEFSWRMMSDTLDGWVSLRIHDAGSGRKFDTHPHSTAAPVTLNAHAIQRLLALPELLEQYVAAEAAAASHHILGTPLAATPPADDASSPPRRLAVYAECWKSVNRRPFQRWCDPLHDFAAPAAAPGWRDGPAWMLPRVLGRHEGPSPADEAALVVARAWRARGYRAEMFTDIVGRPPFRDRILRSAGHTEARLICAYGACAFRADAADLAPAQSVSAQTAAGAEVVLQTGDWATLAIGRWHSVRSATADFATQVQMARELMVGVSSWVYVMK
jgi:vitamin K-dependent gamma-carboxylase